MNPRCVLVLTALLLAAPVVRGAPLYLSSVDGGNNTFAMYDPLSNTWTPLNPFPTSVQMAVGADGELYGWNRTTGMIQIYDPIADAWSDVMPAPVGPTGVYGNLEITVDGMFLYTERTRDLLYHSSPAGWSTVPLGFPASAAGDYDPTTNQYVIGELNSGTAHQIDLSTWAITDFTEGPGTNGNPVRFGVVMENQYFYQFARIGIHSFDLSDPTLPAVDVSGDYGGFTDSAAGDRADGKIYIATVNGSGLLVWDLATATLTALAPYQNIGNRSSLAYAGAAPKAPVDPPSCSLSGVAGLQSGDVQFSLNPTSPTALTVDVSFQYSTDGGATFSMCTASPVSPVANPAFGIPTSPATFVWASQADGVGLNGIEMGVIVRALVSDGNSPTAGSCDSVAFDVENITPPSCTVVAPPSPAIGDILITLDTASMNSAVTDVLFEFSTNGGATYAPCSAAAGSALSNPAVAVPNGQALFLWDSRADGVALFALQAGVLVRSSVDDGVALAPVTCSTMAFDVDNSLFCNGICGDCDQNGSPTIDILDALEAAQIGAQIFLPSNQQRACCDVDSSGGIDILDSLAMAKEAAAIPVVLVCPE